MCLTTMSLGVPRVECIYHNFIRFARASSDVIDLNCRNKVLPAKLHKQGYRYHKLCKAFSKFYRRDSELVEKYNVSCNKVYRNQNPMMT